MVWSEGRTQTLKKALELEDIKIVSTLWFQETFEEMKLADEQNFKPIALNKLLQKGKLKDDINVLSRGIQKANVMNKKRT